MTPPQPRLRVLVVEDSATVRARLVEILASDPSIEVVGEAADGEGAIELCRALRPGLVTMDMMLPGTTGLAATEQIMAHFPTPILIVSASTNRGELFRTYEALAAGAVDVLEKPRGDEPDGAWERQFLAAVRVVAKVRVITHPRARLARLGATHAPAATPAERAPAGGAVVALGASTGGPAALLEVLRALPPSVRAPVLVVLHIGEAFAGSFAEWVDGQTPRRAAFATEGMEIASAGGSVVLAPPGRHLVAEGGRLVLSRAPERHSCRPSVDVLFESLARERGRSVVAALLTGMGRDGAAGLLAVRNAGGATIAQDEATSVVWGMPREAVLLGAAAQVLPVGEIGRALAAHAAAREGTR